MPEPREVRLASPPPIWPSNVPGPMSDAFEVTSGQRVENVPVLFGPTRIDVRARTAPMSWAVSIYMSAAQMQAFETWYRTVVETAEGEFYARWVGGSRVVAFSEGYEYRPVGAGYLLSAQLVRTRIDHSACDAFLVSIFQNLYVATITHVDRYVADLAAVDRYVSDWSLQMIADNEC